MARNHWSAALAVCLLAACSDTEQPAEDAESSVTRVKARGDEGQLGKRPAKFAERGKAESRPAPSAPRDAADQGAQGRGGGGTLATGQAGRSDPGAGARGIVLGTAAGGDLGASGAGASGGLMGTAAGGSLGVGGLGLRGTGAGGYGSGTRLPPAPSAVVGTFQRTGVNGYVSAEDDRLSTFSADVDTASYTLARRVLLSGRLPPQESVRVEEFLNYFRYDYPAPEDAPLAASLELAPSPYSHGWHLLRVGLQGRTVPLHERKPAHLTFLVDVSGSMSGPDRLPLAKRALRMLVDQLHDGDTVALVTYAGRVKLALPHTGLEHKARIHQAIEELDARGGTGMASGIKLAYEQAAKKLDSHSVSRVIILSDGDANIGPSTPDQLLELIRGHAKEGVTVTTVGFGMGNYRSALMERFADAGNGNHFYVDSHFAARRVFVEELGGTLEVIAQDVKLQVEFDPRRVRKYRLVGYENRDVADADFRNDRVDGGEVGSGHRVTALYELLLDDAPPAGAATVRVRAKKPRGVEAGEWIFPLKGADVRGRFGDASADFRFAAAVMGAAELFRQSPHAARWKLDDVLRIAEQTAGDHADRREFVELLRKARGIEALAVR